MRLNLHDPDSILNWWKVLPDRHDDYLAYKVQVSPEFAPAINEARRRIAARPELAYLLARVVQRRRHGEALHAVRAEQLTQLQHGQSEVATA